MKKIISLFILLSFCFSFYSISHAMKLTGSKKFDLPKYVVMQQSINNNPNGLSIIVNTAYTGMFLSDIPDNAPYYYYKHGILGYTYVLGVTGLNVTLVNNSNQLLVIKWSESSYTMGGYAGIPFLDGMKYINAGNPSALADSILPPNTQLTRNIFQSNVQFINGQWQKGYQPIREDSGLQGSLYLKVVDQNGNSSYASVTTSPIFVPQSSIEMIMND